MLRIQVLFSTIAIHVHVRIQLRNTSIRRLPPNTDYRVAVFKGSHIRYNKTAYKGLVHPVLEHESFVCDSSGVGLSDELENVQTELLDL